MLLACRILTWQHKSILNTGLLAQDDFDFLRFYSVSMQLNLIVTSAAEFDRTVWERTTGIARAIEALVSLPTELVE